MTRHNSDRFARTTPVDQSKLGFVSIIDDEESVRRAVGSLVRSIGYAAETFSSAEEFLEILPSFKTSCVISDIRMPGMTGVDLYRYLRDSGEPIPFILITGFADENLRKNLGNEVDILEKPFSADKLAEFLERAGARRSKDD